MQAFNALLASFGHHLAAGFNRPTEQLLDLAIKVSDYRSAMLACKDGMTSPGIYNPIIAENGRARVVLWEMTAPAP